MKVRPYVSTNMHGRVVKFANRNNLDICEAYSRIIQLTIDVEGCCISDYQDDRLKMLEESKRELMLYINNTQCKWCVSKAQILCRAMDQLIQLHIKAEGFVQQLEHSDCINKLGDEINAKQ